jgi:hypothetical protein
MDFLSISILFDFSHCIDRLPLRNITSYIVLEKPWSLAVGVYLTPSSQSHRPALRARGCFLAKSTAPAAIVRDNRLPVQVTF